MYNVQWRRKRRWRSRHGSLCTHSMHLACAFGKMFVFKTSNDVISRPPPTPPSRDLTMLTTPMCGEHGRITGLRHGRMRRKSLLLCTKLPWMGGTDTEWYGYGETGGTDTERCLDGRNGYGETRKLGTKATVWAAAELWCGETLVLRCNWSSIFPTDDPPPSVEGHILLLWALFSISIWIRGA